MVVKYLVFFFVLILYVQKNEATDSSLRLFNLQAQVKQGIANLVEDAEKRTANANVLMLRYSEQITTYGNQRYNDAQAIINDLKVKTETELNTQISNAGGNLDKLISCTQEYEAELQEFWLTTFKNVTSCVTDKIETGITIIKNIVGASITITNIAISLPDRINTSCPLNKKTLVDQIAQAGCALIVIAQASTEVIAQGLIIAANVAQAAALISSISTIQIDLPICLATNALAASIAFVPVIVPIVECTLK